MWVKFEQCMFQILVPTHSPLDHFRQIIDFKYVKIIQLAICQQLR